MGHLVLTGGSGFLGGRVAARLTEAAIPFTAIVRDATRAPSGARVVTADLADRAALERAARDVGPATTLVHVAATMPSPALTSDEAAARHTADVRAAADLLAAFGPVEHVVFASSVDVFGAPASLPIDESHALAPTTDYARAKVDAERVLAEACARDGARLTVLRYTQIYGPGEPRIKAIPMFIAAVAAGISPELHGDGSERRDYLHVDDAADACLAAVTRRAEGTYIVASGQSTTVRDVLDAIIALGGGTVAPTVHERRKPKVDLAYDVSRARRDLGWQARTSLADGLRSSYEWFTRQADA